MKPAIQTLVKRKTLVLLFIIVSAASCIDTRFPVSGNNVFPDGQQTETFADLTEMIRTIPRVKVTGSRDLASVSIGPNNPLNPPLFILDGVEMGYNYAQLYHLVDIGDIRRIYVLLTADAFSRYGSRAENGAILIETSSKLRFF
jgi:hypothetical protein